jgi:DHA2 family multidrug resistance protein
VAHDLSHAYTMVFIISTLLVALAYLPAAFLPKKPVNEHRDSAATAG